MLRSEVWIPSRSIVFNSWTPRHSRHRINISFPSKDCHEIMKHIVQEMNRNAQDQSILFIHTVQLGCQAYCTIWTMSSFCTILLKQSYKSKYGSNRKAIQNDMSNVICNVGTIWKVRHHDSGATDITLEVLTLSANSWLMYQIIPWGHAE